MKKIALLIFLPLIFLVANHQAQATSDEQEVFLDIQAKHFNHDAIEYLKRSDVIDGYPDGEYKSRNRMNRAEFVKVMIETLYSSEEIEACTSTSFTDVPEGEWFAKYVCMAEKHGVVSGYPDRTFRPAEYINFAEISKVLSESLDVVADASGTNNEWFAGYINGLAKQKAIPVTVDFAEEEVDRGEVAEMVYRLKADRQDKVSKTYQEIIEPFPTITSCPALLEEFTEYRSRQYYRVDSFEEDFVIMEFADEGEATTGASFDNAVPATTAQKSEAADEFSQTNIQVAGVDEADIIKNDGEFIYMIKGNEVRIIKAFPASSMEEVSAIKFSDDYSFYPRELYVTDNQLVVVGQANNYYYIQEDVEPGVKIAPPYYSADQTKVFVLDISDRSNPETMRTVTYDGTYQTSRRIDDQVYFVLNGHPNVWNFSEIQEGNQLLPRFSDSGSEFEPLVGCDDIRYFPGHRVPQYLITSSFDITDKDSEIHKNVFLGASENVYSSLDNFYVASTVTEFDHYSDWDWSRDRSKTHVFKFKLEDGEMVFDKRGQIPGRILNQFSMDEYNDHFRIATTTGDQWRGSDSNNNVYVLDSKMQTVGSLEGLAKGERIFSTRFLGDRLYMVTFRQIDPLFVIDLRQPNNPEVLGELKIPGFSNYLHPFDEDHIIGFGKDTGENDWGGANVTGFKMALFDVSDVENPEQKFVEVIGDQGTHSELLNNHKALLFDKEKELLAFPITINEKVIDDDLQCGKYTFNSCPGLCQTRCIPSECTTDDEGVTTCTDDCNGPGSCMNPDYDRYETTFSGAVVYTLNETDGFEERGRITHYSQDDLDNVLFDYFPYDYEKNIQRIIYIGDFLYTIAQGGVKASSMQNAQEANFLELE